MGSRQLNQHLPWALNCTCRTESLPDFGSIRGWALSHCGCITGPCSWLWQTPTSRWLIPYVPPPLTFTFHRELSPAEGICWGELCGRLSRVVLSTETNTITWKLMDSRSFSVKSLCAKLMQGPLLDVAMGLWKASLSLKVKVFLWQIFCNRLPTSINVAERQGPSNGSCSVCGAPEYVNHVFFPLPPCSLRVECDPRGFVPAVEPDLWGGFARHP